MGLLTMMQYANAHTDNTFAIWILISLYVVIFMGIIFKRGEESTSAAFISSGMSIGFVGTFLLMAQLITVKTFSGVVIVAVISFALAYWSNKD